MKRSTIKGHGRLWDSYFRHAVHLLQIQEVRSWQHSYVQFFCRIFYRHSSCQISLLRPQTKTNFSSLITLKTYMSFVVAAFLHAIHTRVKIVPRGKSKIFCLYRFCGAWIALQHNVKMNFFCPAILELHGHIFRNEIVLTTYAHGRTQRR